MRWRYDTLIGGLMHGRTHVIEDRRSSVYLIPMMTVLGGRYNELVYRRRLFTFMHPNEEQDIVEFYADDQLDDDAASRYLWTEVMRAMGARPLR